MISSKMWSMSGVTMMMILVRRPWEVIEDAEFFDEFINHLNNDDLLFGSPWWIESLKELKHVTMGLLYKDCRKEWRMLYFDLQMLMLKGLFGWSDTSFNELLSILGCVLLKDNKVLANIYRAKELIWSVSQSLQKIHSCPNHCILYTGHPICELGELSTP